GAGNLKKRYLFGLTLLVANVVSTHLWWHNIVFASMDDQLWGSDLQASWVGVAITFRHRLRRAVQQFQNRIIAEVQLMSAAQINHAGERNGSEQPGSARGQPQRQLTSAGMAGDSNTVHIEVVSRSV